MLNCYAMTMCWWVLAISCSSRFVFDLQVFFKLSILVWFVNFSIDFKFLHLNKMIQWWFIDNFYQVTFSRAKALKFLSITLEVFQFVYRRQQFEESYCPHGIRLKIRVFVDSHDEFFQQISGVFVTQYFFCIRF